MHLLFGSVKQDAWLRAWILSLQSLGRTAHKFVKKITLVTPQVNITDEASPFRSLSTWSLNKLQISQFWPFRSWPSACTRKSHQHPSWLGTSSCWRHSLTCVCVWGGGGGWGWRREGGGGGSDLWSSCWSRIPAMIPAMKLEVEESCWIRTRPFHYLVRNTETMRQGILSQSTPAVEAVAHTASASCRIWTHYQSFADFEIITNLKQNVSQSARAESIHKGVNLRSKDVTTSTTTKKRLYLWWSLCTLYLHACQVRVTVGDSGLCSCTCVTYFER